MKANFYIFIGKGILFTSLLLTGCLAASAQNAVLTNGGSLINNGYIILNGNFENQNSDESNLGTGTFEFNGTTGQTISGPNEFGTLKINNPAGVTITEEDQEVETQLILSSGNLILGEENLTLGASGTISGTPSPSNMVVANGTGELRKEFPGGFTGNFSYPVGDLAGTPEYSPVTLSFSSGTFSSENYVGVNLANTQFPGDPNTGSHLNRYWNISSDGVSGFTCNALFNYVTADVVGTESQINCVRLSPAPEVAFGMANTAIHQLSASLNSFGSYSGTILGSSDHILNLTLFLEGLYRGNNSMRPVQDGNGPHFQAGIADQINVELHGASDFSTLVYASPNPVNLSTSGIATLNVPANINGTYYIAIKHRNSIETVTANPVSFSAGTISYNFSTSDMQAFGQNLKDMADGTYAIYTGDTNQNGGVGIDDMALTENDSDAFTSGYVSTDLDGDGGVGIEDMAFIDNNNSLFISAITP